MKINKTQMLLHSVTRLLNRNADAHIRRILAKSHPAEVAAVLRLLPDADAIHVMEQLKGLEKEGKIFAELGGKFLQTYLILSENRTHIVELLHDMPEDEVAALVAELDEKTAQEILPLIKESTKDEVNEILLYAEDTCGRIMSVNAFVLNQDLTANQAIAVVQNTEHLENLYYIYITDDFNNLVGVVSLRQILQVNSHRLLKEFMTRDVIRVNAFDSQKKAASYVEEYNFVSLPVVNDEGKLLGMVKVDDVIDYIRDEAQDEVFELAGVEPEAIDDFSFWRAFSSRVTWYGLLFIGGVICSEIIRKLFSGFPEKIVFLCFAPLVLRLGGSVTTQGVTFVHQSLLNPSIEKGRSFKALLGQSMTTLLVAFLLSLAVLTYGVLRYRSDFTVPVIISAGLNVVSFFAICMSFAVPILFHKLKLDSLLMSSRFVHFLMDALSLIVFFNFIWLFF